MRAVLVSSAWFGVVPLTVGLVARTMMNTADGVINTLHDGLPGVDWGGNWTVPQTLSNTTNGTTASNHSSINLPTLIAGNTTYESALMHHVTNQILQGQLITCAMVITFVIGFLIREYIIQNAPLEALAEHGLDGERVVPPEEEIIELGRVEPEGPPQDEAEDEILWGDPFEAVQEPYDEEDEPEDEGEDSDEGLTMLVTSRHSSRERERVPLPMPSSSAGPDLDWYQETVVPKKTERLESEEDWETMFEEEDETRRYRQAKVTEIGKGKNRALERPPTPTPSARPLPYALNLPIPNREEYLRNAFGPSVHAKAGPSLTLLERVERFSRKPQSEMESPSVVAASTSTSEPAASSVGTSEPQSVATVDSDSTTQEELPKEPNHLNPTAPPFVPQDPPTQTTNVDKSPEKEIDDEYSKDDFADTNNLVPPVLIDPFPLAPSNNFGFPEIGSGVDKAVDGQKEGNGVREESDVPSSSAKLSPPTPFPFQLPQWASVQSSLKPDPSTSRTSSPSTPVFTFGNPIPSFKPSVAHSTAEKFEPIVDPRLCNEAEFSPGWERRTMTVFFCSMLHLSETPVSEYRERAQGLTTSLPVNPWTKFEWRFTDPVTMSVAGYMMRDAWEAAKLLRLLLSIGEIERIIRGSCHGEARVLLEWAWMLEMVLAEFNVPGPTTEVETARWKSASQQVYQRFFTPGAPLAIKTWFEPPLHDAVIALRARVEPNEEGVEPAGWEDVADMKGAWREVERQVMYKLGRMGLLKKAIAMPQYEPFLKQAIEGSRDRDSFRSVYSVNGPMRLGLLSLATWERPPSVVASPIGAAPSLAPSASFAHLNPDNALPIPNVSFTLEDAMSVEEAIRLAKEAIRTGVLPRGPWPMLGNLPEVLPPALANISWTDLEALMLVSQVKGMPAQRAADWKLRLHKVIALREGFAGPGGPDASASGRRAAMALPPPPRFGVYIVYLRLGVLANGPPPAFVPAAPVVAAPRPPRPRRPPVPELRPEDAVDNDDDDVDDFVMDDMEGLMEMIGMKGSLLGLAQNVGGLTVVLAAALITFVHIPHLFGKFLVMAQAHRVIIAPFRGLVTVRNLSHDGFDRINEFRAALWQYFRSNTSESTGTILSAPRSFPTARLLPLLSFVQDYLREPYLAISRTIATATERLQRVPVGTSAADRVLAVAIGYAGFIFSSILYLASGVDQARSHFVGSTLTRVLRQSLTIFKVGTFVFIELAIFPAVCGVLLNFTTVGLFPHATVASRVEAMKSMPWSIGMMTWLAGTTYMFIFSNLVGSCRKALRPGVCWFIRDPDDPRYHPIREILARHALTQAKKILASAVMYGLVVVAGIGAITGLLSALTGLLPLRLHYDRPWSTSMIDLILLQEGVPILMAHFEPREWVRNQLDGFSRRVALHLGLQSFLYGTPGLHTEEGIPVLPLNRRWYQRLPFILFYDSKIEPNSMRGVKEGCGSYVRVPNTDLVPVKPGRKMHIAVNERGEALDPADIPKIEVQRAEARVDPTAPNEDHFGIVYLPPAFWWRVYAYMFCVWAYTIMLIVGAIGAPLYVGRAGLDALWDEEHHDMYAYIFGVGLFMVVLTGIRKARTVAWVGLGAATATGVASMGAARVRGTHTAPTSALNYARTLVHWITGTAKAYAYRILHLSLFTFVGLGLLPILTSLLVDLYCLSLFRGKTVELGTIYLADQWSFGVMYLSVVWRAVQYAPREVWNRIYWRPWMEVRLAYNAHGAERALALFNTSFTIPLIMLTLSALMLPIVVTLVVIGPLILYLPPTHVPEVLAQNGWLTMTKPEKFGLVLRVLYPTVVSGVGHWWTMVVVGRRMESWLGVVRDRRFLEQQTLENYERPPPEQQELPKEEEVA